MISNKNEKEIVTQDIKKIIAKIAELDINELEEKLSLYDDLGIDSLDIEEIIFKIEDKYDIIFTDEELEDMDTINDIADIILKKEEKNMEFNEVIFKRKSVRSYTGEQISDEELKKILESANASPIGMGRFNEVHLTVVQNKEFLDEINTNAGKMFGDETRKVLYNAPTLILISHKNVNEKTASIAYSDCACVFENMTLTATELGLGSCAIWGATMALNANKELVKKLNLEDEFTPCCAIAIGKTDDKFEERERTLDKIKINYIK